MNRARLILICGLLTVLNGCKSDRSANVFLSIDGKTMGTTYSCQVQGDFNRSEMRNSIDSLLNLVNAVASTYIPNSLISRLNQADSRVCQAASDSTSFHMLKLIEEARVIEKVTGGYFDPTMMPLVNYWGFGYKQRIKRSKTRKSKLDSILAFCQFDFIGSQVIDDEYCLIKKDSRTQLDFSAIAKGYAVDLIADHFIMKGSANFYVNIGGEVVTKGINAKNNPWSLGINYPDTSSALRDIFAVIELGSGAMASSGNYRQYYVNEEGQVSHTINPKTGMAKPSDLLSVTIVAENCATADAYATACMAMGYEKARNLVAAHNQLEGFFIYRSDQKVGLQHEGTTRILNKIKLKE